MQVEKVKVGSQRASQAMDGSRMDLEHCLHWLHKVKAVSQWI
jgi:hypothetical protein